MKKCPHCGGTEGLMRQPDGFWLCIDCYWQEEEKKGPEKMPDASYIITDFEDREIKVGTRVRQWDFNREHPDWGTDASANYIGTVTDLGEWDGDYDDNLQRAVGIPPYVTVKWDDGTEESFRTSEWEHRMVGMYEYEYTKGKVEEIDVIENNTNEKE